MQSLHGCEYRHGTWAAVLESTPPHKPRLKVTGIVTCPTGGYEVSLRKAAIQRLNPRILVLEVLATPPSEIAHEMMTEHELRFEQPDSQMYTDVHVVPFDIAIPVETAA